MHVSTILSENLSMLLGTEGIVITNRNKQADVDYYLSVQCIRFDGQPGKEARLDCRWYLDKGDGFAIAHPQRFSAVQPLEGSAYTDLVATLSRMLADLSREIAKVIDAD